MCCSNRFGNLRHDFRGRRRNGRLDCCFGDECGPCEDFFGGDGGHFDGGCGCGERGRERVINRHGRDYFENVHHNVFHRDIYHHHNECSKHTWC